MQVLSHVQQLGDHEATVRARIVHDAFDGLLSLIRQATLNSVPLVIELGRVRRLLHVDDEDLLRHGNQILDVLLEAIEQVFEIVASHIAGYGAAVTLAIVLLLLEHASGTVQLLTERANVFLPCFDALLLFTLRLISQVVALILDAAEDLLGVGPLGTLHLSFAIGFTN